MKNPPFYVVYEIECVRENHWYVGYTGDYDTRMSDHCCNEGAQFTRKHKVKTYQPVCFVQTIEEAKTSGEGLVLRT